MYNLTVRCKLHRATRFDRTGLAVAVLRCRTVTVCWNRCTGYHSIERTDLGLSYRPQFASSKQHRRLLCSELDLKQGGAMWSAMPTERYVSSRPPAIPNKPLCMDQLSSCHLKALVSLAGGYRSSSSSRATLLEAVSSELQSVNGKTWHVSNCKVCALTTLSTSLTLVEYSEQACPTATFA